LKSNNLNSSLLRVLVIDSGEHSKEVLSKQLSQLSASYSEFFFDYVPLSEARESGFVEHSIPYQSMLFIIVIVAVLVLLNSISVSVNWIIWYSREIAIRRICGADETIIRKWIITRMFSYISISAGIGIALSHLFLIITQRLHVNVSTQLMFGNHLTLFGVVLGLIMMVLLCSITVIVVLRLYARKKITEMI
jgi:ABC-type antimicrobial peptide transport system permease subunit